MKVLGSEKVAVAPQNGKSSDNKRMKERERETFVFMSFFTARSAEIFCRSEDEHVVPSL